MGRKHVCLLNTGGTIGMVRTEGGYAPAAGALERYLEEVPELGRDEMPQLTLETLPPLLDSADMRPHDWVRIAQAIAERHDDFDGFVLVHGTDTMAYTASALSFLLPGLARPVVLTGSQLPLSHVRTDGREHVITSLLIAARDDLPEVGIYFGSVLLRGNRTQKVRSAELAAFESGNLPPLAKVGVEIEVNRHLVREKGAGIAGEVALRAEPEVLAVRVFPGMSAALLDRLLAPPADAVVLETYGAGNVPTADRALIEAVGRATDRGVVVVSCSQTHAGRVRPDLYSTGSALASAGAVGGHDMTPEAALTKLYVLLGRGLSPDDVRAQVAQDLAGEITVPAA